MKNKGILIAVVAVVVMALVGVFIFLYLRDPEILTKSPSEIISGGIGDGEEEEEEEILTPAGNEFLDPMGGCLITSELSCGNAVILHKSDGTRLKGIGLTDISVGSKLYAPISGHVTVYTVRDVEPMYTMITLSEDPNWSADNQVGRAIVFLADGLDILKKEVSAGEAFAEVRENGEVYNGFYDRKIVLVVSFDTAWSQMIDQSIDDPALYLKDALENLK